MISMKELNEIALMAMALVYGLLSFAQSQHAPPTVGQPKPLTGAPMIRRLDDLWSSVQDRVLGQIFSSAFPT